MLIDLRTTTTRTGKDGKKQTTVQTVPGQQTIQEMPAETPNNLLSPEDAARSEQSHTPPSVPGAPEVPSRSPARKSADIQNPVSPVDAKHNFSYPSRGNLREGVGTEDGGGSHRGSGTIESLKQAAIGLHVSCNIFL
jgi:hypothetical protein